MHFLFYVAHVYICYIFVTLFSRCHFTLLLIDVILSFILLSSFVLLPVPVHFCCCCCCYIYAFLLPVLCCSVVVIFVTVRSIGVVGVIILFITIFVGHFSFCSFCTCSFYLLRVLYILYYIYISGNCVFCIFVHCILSFVQALIFCCTLNIFCWISFQNGAWPVMSAASWRSDVACLPFAAALPHLRTRAIMCVAKISARALGKR